MLANVHIYFYHSGYNSGIYTCVQADEGISSNLAATDSNECMIEESPAIGLDSLYCYQLVNCLKEKKSAHPSWRNARSSMNIFWPF
jgi:hypothetical protein